jgi:hypothetical protein
MPKDDILKVSGFKEMKIESLDYSILIMGFRLKN